MIENVSRTRQLALELVEAAHAKRQGDITDQFYSDTSKDVKITAAGSMAGLLAHEARRLGHRMEVIASKQQKYYGAAGSLIRFMGVPFKYPRMQYKREGYYLDAEFFLDTPPLFVTEPEFVDDVMVGMGWVFRCGLPDDYTSGGRIIISEAACDAESDVVRLSHRYSIFQPPDANLDPRAIVQGWGFDEYAAVSNGASKEAQEDKIDDYPNGLYVEPLGLVMAANRLLRSPK